MAVKTGSAAGTAASVVFRSPFFWPEEISTGRYNSFLVKTLVDSGCDMTVVCFHPFYPAWKTARTTGEIPFACRTYRGGAGIRFPASQVLRRLLLELAFSLHVFRSGRRLEGTEFDVVVDVYPPNVFAFFGRRGLPRRARVVGIVHDLQGLMSQAKSSFLRRIVGRLIRPVEGAALRKADHLVFLSNGMKSYALREYGIDANRCSVVFPFPSLPKDINSGEYPAPRALRRREKKTLVYSGALGEKQAPEKLYELMNEFGRRNDSYDVHIFSGGRFFSALEERSDEKDNVVQFHPLVPEDELPGLLKASTIQIIPQELGLSDGAFPSKAPNLIAAGTAIFGIADRGSELHEILSVYSRGQASDSWNLESNLALLESLAYSDDVVSSTTNPGDEDLRKRFDVSSLCEIIVGGSKA